MTLLTFRPKVELWYGYAWIKNELPILPFRCKCHNCGKKCIIKLSAESSKYICIDNYTLTCGCGRHGQLVECYYRADPISFCCWSHCEGSAILVSSHVKRHVVAQRLLRWRSWKWTSLMLCIVLPASHMSPSGEHINFLDQELIPYCYTHRVVLVLTVWETLFKKPKTI